MLVLASASPRRRELLRYLVADFQVVPAEIDETLGRGPFPEAAVAVALRKARAVAGRAGGVAVLAADTLVVIDGEALGKPGGAAEAGRMLRRLRGRAHEVVTGVAVLAADGRDRTGAAVSRVLMARLSDALIDDYVATGAPFDKAGGYAIQDLAGALVDGVVGSYTNVIGLPLGLTRRLLAEAGVPVLSEAARR